MINLKYKPMIETRSERHLRKSGILMHISSIPSSHGIGTMGKAARDFVDFLQESGQSYWQILPICPTSYGDSPYQSYSAFAGNPYFIDLDELNNMGLLEAKDYEGVDWESTDEKVNYGVLYEKRYPILRKAAINFLDESSEEFEKFCKENEDWLPEFALFMALKDVHEGKPWSEWKEEYRNRDKEAIEQAKNKYKMEINLWKVYQYLFFKEWGELKKYANNRDIHIIGDLPIYVSLDSVDVWAHPELFQLDENKIPTKVAGCPPDAFSEDGQLWGNPLYNWDYMEQTDFQWWINRIQYLCKVYDVLRIDHFRGFDSYYAIPYGESTARNGVWKQGPGMKLFNKVEETIGRQHIIAEDLGYLTKSVREMLKDSGFPGMKVLEFAFDSRDSGCASDYLPHNYPENCVAYTGTHDNETIVGWWKSITPAERKLARDYLCDYATPEEELYKSFISLIMRSSAKVCVIPMQDYMGLDNRFRMNKPSTVGINWKWRIKKRDLTKKLQKEIHDVTLRYGRKNWD